MRGDGGPGAILATQGGLTGTKTARGMDVITQVMTWCYQAAGF